ncbi:MAG: CIA30 family protein [Gammaproteobacteria bacterium]|nr:CIA30 family protein [Gammaproteobacteria bacterium]
MKNLLSIAALLLLLLAALLWLPQPEPLLPEAQQPGPDMAHTSDEGPVTLISNVRLFDGERWHAATSILLRDGLVHSIGPDLAAPAQAVLVDGSGKTALPGLIDAHVHSFGTAQEDALRFGITTMLDMFRPPQDFPRTHAERASLQASDRADLYSAGYLATAAGGHGTQYGIAVPTLAGADEADAWVAARQTEGSDWIKIVIEPGWGQQRLPTLDAGVVGALIRAAHDRDLLAVAHVSTYADAMMAIEAGIDGLVHLFADRRIDDGFIAAARAADIFVVPTMPVLAGIYGHNDTDWMLTHPVLGPRLPAGQRNNLDMRFPLADDADTAWSNVGANLIALHTAGIPILAGSDAPNPATTYGASLHHALRLLVAAGLPAADALRAASSVPAREFGLAGRGCLKPGCRADLLLVAGDPLTDIAATAMIDAVWKNGHQLSFAMPAMQPDTTSSAAVSGEQDLLADPSRWMAAADDYMGGASSAAISWSQTDDASSLQVSGQLEPGHVFPYAGAMWFASTIPMQPENFSTRTHLVLQIEGAAGDYQALLFSGASQASQPQQVPIKVGELNRIELDAINGLELNRLRAIGVFASGAAREVDFRIVQARLE